MTKETTKGWEKEFDKKFVGITQGTKRVWWVDDPDRVKDFIASELSKERERVVEKIKETGTKVLEGSDQLCFTKPKQDIIILPYKALDDLIKTLADAK